MIRTLIVVALIFFGLLAACESSEVPTGLPKPSDDPSFELNPPDAPVAEGPRVWVVLSDNSGSAPFIQAAIDSSAPGDTVAIGPGTYYENLLIFEKSIVLTSLGGRDRTIIDGSRELASVIAVMNCGPPGVTISRLTIQRGYGTWSRDGGHRGGGYARRGGGLFVEDSFIEISDNRIQNNFVAIAGDYAGGVYWGTDVFGTLRGNEVLNNEGSGVVIHANDVEVSGNTFAYSQYSGLRGTGWDLRVSDNMFIGNYLYGLYPGQFTVDHTLSGNYFRDNGVGLRLFRLKTMHLEHNTFWNNTTHSIELLDTDGTLMIKESIFSGSLVAIYRSKCQEGLPYSGTVVLGVDNLFWQNMIFDEYEGRGRCFRDVGSYLVMDPLLCDQGPLSLPSLSQGSPAITDSIAYGANHPVGCP